MSNLLATDFDELYKYACYEGTEIGDYVLNLVEVRRSHTSHGMTDEFDVALDNECRHWLERFRTETHWETLTVPQPDQEHTSLIWNDE